MGEWLVNKAFFPAQGQPIRSTGKCRQFMIHDGRFLQSDFVFEQGGRKSTGQGIIGFEPNPGRFTSFWTDSRQTRVSVRRSRDPFDGSKIVLHGIALEGEARPAYASKTISHLEENGRKLIHRQYSLEADGRERLIMELVMTRKSG